jgi:hypothetical protein
MVDLKEITSTQVAELAVAMVRKYFGTLFRWPEEGPSAQPYSYRKPDERFRTVRTVPRDGRVCPAAIAYLVAWFCLWLASIACLIAC